jgi:hypothetical protein
LGNKYPFFYKLELEKFKYSQETIDVGIEMIDNTVVDEAYTISLNVNTETGNGNFTVGESVYANNASGTVTFWDRPQGLLKVTDILGTFTANVVITGNTSNATFRTTTAPDPLLDPQEREMYDNKIIQTEASVIMDFSETNPFGDIT